MTESFTASNGAIIHRTSAGALALGNYVFFSPGEEEAFREFFQNERDEKLGIWRHPDFPDEVVYRWNENWVLVIDELSGASTEHRRADVEAMRDKSFVSQSERLARLYFEAHPEPKPWLAAKIGEVWVLSTADGESAAYSVMSVRESEVVFESHEGRYALNDSDIEGARRIWPEDAS
jgi:hypothetical protein